MKSNITQSELPSHRRHHANIADSYTTLRTTLRTNELGNSAIPPLHRTFLGGPRAFHLILLSAEPVEIAAAIPLDRVIFSLCYR